MTVVARTNALLASTSDDTGQGELVLTHVAARLDARLPRYLATIADLDIAIKPATGIVKFGAWVRASSMTSVYHIGSSCAMVIAVDDTLAGILLERQLGGARSDATRRVSGQCRATASLGRAIAGGVSLAVGDAWPGGRVAEIVAVEDGGQFARADDNVATITLSLSVSGGSIGQIAVAFAMEGLARISGAPKPPRVGDWDVRLRDSVLAARLPVRAILARPELPAASVMRLAVGDVLPISKPENVPLYAGDHIVGAGVIFERAGRTAVQIKLTEPLSDD
jgi:flagellar motor switch protein FliM